MNKYFCRKINAMETIIQDKEARMKKREELMKRYRAYKEQKKAHIEKLKEIVRSEYKKRTGKEPESIEVWG